MKQITSPKGFTLIEVLVALVLLAVALTAVIKTTSENTINTGHLRDKYFASIIAANKLAEIQTAKSWPGIGLSNGTTEMAKQSWQWDLKVEATPDSRLRKLLLSVSLEQEKDNTLHRLISYIGQP
ncbi:MAG: type II secretion system minor pseudopilin GspI [Gammaproteobacteria bacterium]|nr:type II secretion system minor pseudopilin GspI [Gammaproteobacteria bacterium]